MPLKTSKNLSSPSLWKAEQNYSESQLSEIALDLATELRVGDRVLLEGPMGSGKTTFARHLLTGLGVTQPPEGSPSFAIAHEYQSPVGGVVHIDFYRIRNESEIDEAGITAYYWERKLIIISEWLSNWPLFESQVIGSGRTWRVSLSFDEAGNDLERVVKVTVTPAIRAII